MPISKRFKVGCTLLYTLRQTFTPEQYGVDSKMDCIQLLTFVKSSHGLPDEIVIEGPDDEVNEVLSVSQTTFQEPHDDHVMR